MAPPTAGEAAIAAAILEALTDRTLAANAKRLAWAIREEIAADDAVFEPRRLIPH